MFIMNIGDPLTNYDLLHFLREINDCPFFHFTICKCYGTAISSQGELDHHARKGFCQKNKRKTPYILELTKRRNQREKTKYLGDGNMR